MARKMGFYQPWASQLRELRFSHTKFSFAICLSLKKTLPLLKNLVSLTFYKTFFKGFLGKIMGGALKVPNFSVGAVGNKFHKELLQVRNSTVNARSQGQNGFVNLSALNKKPTRLRAAVRKCLV